MNFPIIYILDDYLLTRLAYKKSLELENNYKIEDDFSNSSDLLNKMKQKPCDIAIVDLELVEGEIQELFDLIKYKYPKTKLIATCSQNSALKLFDISNSNIRAYALKRTCAKNLQNIIDMVFSGGFWMDAEIAKIIFKKMENQNKSHAFNSSEKERVVNTLTKRELEVLKLMIEGKTNSQIAREIIVSINTAKAHVGNILTKLSARDRVQAVVKAVRANIF